MVPPVNCFWSQREGRNSLFSLRKGQGKHQKQSPCFRSSNFGAANYVLLAWNLIRRRDVVSSKKTCAVGVKVLSQGPESRVGTFSVIRSKYALEMDFSLFSRDISISKQTRKQKMGSKQWTVLELTAWINRHRRCLFPPPFTQKKKRHREIFTNTSPIPARSALSGDFRVHIARSYFMEEKNSRGGACTVATRRRRRFGHARVSCVRTAGLLLVSDGSAATPFLLLFIHPSHLSHTHAGHIDRTDASDGSSSWVRAGLSRWRLIAEESV